MFNFPVRAFVASFVFFLLAGGTSWAGPLDERLEPDATKSCRQNVTLPPPNSRPLNGAVKVVAPLTGAYVGQYVVPARTDILDAFADQTGRQPPLVYTGHDWVFGDDDWWTITPDGLWNFDTKLEGDSDVTALELARRLSRQGSILSFSWAVYCCNILSMQFYLRLKKPNGIYGRIASGEFDDYIRRQARRIKTFDGPIMLTLVPEFNFQGIFAFGPEGRDWMTDVDDICGQYGDPAWPDGPERVRDAHRRVVDLFRDEGVRNVTWFMYAASNYMDPNNENTSVWLHPKFFYPGDEYVDWVGQSAYFIDPEWGESVEMWGEKVTDFASAIESGYAAWASITDKPLFLPEFGINSEGGKSRARIMTKVFEELLPALPRIKAVTFAQSELFRQYFNLPDIGSRPDEKAAWRKAVRDNPYYKDKMRTIEISN